ncbi:MAG: SDR family oxidoreductase [Alphaproteobacteria bacterium]
MAERARVLVTGASGFIATRIIALLIKRGYDVTGTLRDAARAPSVTALIKGQGVETDGLRFVEADLMADQGWAEAVTGCTYVMHVASPLPITRPKDENDLIVPARGGTVRVLKAAADAGIKRVVLTSSVAAVAYGTGGRETPFTEADWSNPDADDIGSYEKSKTLAERAAWAFQDHHGGFELTAVNPSLVLGPVLEKDYGSSVEVVRQLISGRIPMAPRIGYPIVDVRDVADLHVRAMEHPDAAGERFIAASGYYSMLEIGRVLKSHMPEIARRVPSREAPDVLIRLMGRFDPAIGGILFELGKRRAVSNEKARTMLAWEPRPDDETIVLTARSLIEKGVVRG